MSDNDVRLEQMKQRAEARDHVDVEHFRDLDGRKEELFHVSDAAAR